MNGVKNRFVLAAVVSGAGWLMGCSPASVEPGENTATEEEALGYVCPEGVPASLKPDADQSIKGMLNGVGVQIYLCGTTPTNSTPAWLFVAPNANLLADSGKLVGTHFIGPVWQGNDASSVAASKVAGATVDPAALPWLLLKATAHADEKGIFQDTTSIQRLTTVGGNAPTTGCDASTLGTILQVPYSAEYVFYKTKTHGKVVQCPAN